MDTKNFKPLLRMFTLVNINDHVHSVTKHFNCILYTGLINLEKKYQIDDD